MVDTSTIDLPTTNPTTPSMVLPQEPGVSSGAIPVEISAQTLPDATTMQQQLEAAKVLIPEVVPTGLATITTPTDNVTLPTLNLGPIALATTAPTFYAPNSAPSPEKTAWKWLSWIFMVSSAAVVLLVLFQFWDQGMRIELTTTEELSSREE